MNEPKHTRTLPWLRGAFVALLLGCVGVCTVGEYVVVKAVQWDVRRDVKRRIKAGIPKEELVMLQFSKRQPPSNIVWMHAREFRYEGNMYDVVNQEDIGDSIRYYCILDERDTWLYANIEQQIRQELTGNPQRQRQQTELLQQIPKFFWLPANPIEYGFKCFTPKPMHTAYAIIAYAPSVPSPPPDACLLFSFRV